MKTRMVIALTTEDLCVSHQSSNIDFDRQTQWPSSDAHLAVGVVTVRCELRVGDHCRLKMEATVT